jgi:hypothetical protein
MKVKMVAESLNESVYARLNEEMNAVSEGLLNDFFVKLKKALQSLNTEYKSLDKKDEKAVREFAYKSGIATYVADNPEAGKKALKHWAEKAPIDMLIKFLDEASQVEFKGRTSPSYTKDKKLVVAWKPIDMVNLENQFASGGTGGKTRSGGV